MLVNKVIIGSDHAGFELKKKVIAWFMEKGVEVKDCGTDSCESCDYPDYAHQVGVAIEKGEFEKGVVICGSGNGVQMTVNKYPHVRCALCWNSEIAQLARQHNNANVISLPARFISDEEAMKCLEVFLTTSFEGGRHERRVKKISCLLK